MSLLHLGKGCSSPGTGFREKKRFSSSDWELTLSVWGRGRLGRESDSGLAHPLPSQLPSFVSGWIQPFTKQIQKHRNLTNTEGLYKLRKSIKEWVSGTGLPSPSPSPSWYWSVNSHGLECLGLHRHIDSQMSQSASRNRDKKLHTLPKTALEFGIPEVSSSERNGTNQRTPNILMENNFHLTPRPSCILMKAGQSSSAPHFSI